MISLNNENSNIRRIDELGRIVIPKDIRKKLYIKDNEPLEIFIENGEIRIKKYSELPEISEYLSYLVDLGTRLTDNNYIITDRTHIIATNNNELKDMNLSQSLESIVLSGSEIKNEKKELSITPNKVIDANINIIPLMIEGDRSGVLIEYNENKKLQGDVVVKIFKNLIEKRLNNC